MVAAKSVLMVFLFLCSANAFAQSVDKDPAATLEIGIAPSTSVKGGGSSFGPTVAVEVTPIEHWLELEAGVTPLFARRSTEWDTDLLFKKPWTLSRKAEFMFGVGPEWIHASRNNVVTNSAGRRSRARFHVLAFREGINSAGISNRVTTTILAEGTINRSASVAAS